MSLSHCLLSRHGSRLALIFLLLSIPASLSWSADVCVNTAFDLASALSTAASNGEDDTVQVVQGTYTTISDSPFTYFTEENYSLSILGGYTTACASQTIDPTNTILDGGNTSQVVRLIPSTNTSGDLVVQGFTVQNGYTTGFTDGAGIYIGGAMGYSGNVTVSHNIIQNNNTEYIGGGLSGGSDTGTTRIENNLIINNTASSVHGGASLTSNGIAYVTNNTIYGNTASEDGGLRLSGGTAAFVSNNIFYGNTASDLILDSSGIVLQNNNIQSQSGTGSDSGGNVNVDPQFEGGSSFKLSSSSPLINAGTSSPGGNLPSTDIAGNNRTNSIAPDIGAYEYYEPGSGGDKVSISGTVTSNSQPACALVLANGQKMFSCSGDGSYSLSVPLDANDQITLFAFVSGLAPYKQVITPSGAVNQDIAMATDEGSPEFTVEYSLNGPSESKDGWINMTGTINQDTTPVCALILANGQSMFSCGANSGVFNLDVPLDSNDEITLFAFASGFKPYKQVFQGN